MPVFHEGEPISRDVIEGFFVPEKQASEFAVEYNQASETEKALMLESLKLSFIPDISQCLTNPFYRATCGIDNNLYESDEAYKNRVNELINAQLRSL